MPIFEIESPDGQVVEIEGDSPPSEQELENIFSSISPISTQGQPVQEPQIPEQLNPLQKAVNIGTQGFNTVTDKNIAFSKGILKTADQVSFGAQRSLIDLGVILRVTSPEEAERQKAAFPTPETLPEKAANVFGQFASPVVPGLGAVAGALPKLTQIPQAAKIFQQLTNVAKKHGGKIISAPKNIFKNIASLEGSGYSEKIKPLIAESPEILFESKKGWQKIQGELFDAIQTKKTEIGEKIGSLRQEVFNIENSKGIEVNELVEGLRSIKNQMAGAATTQKRAVDQFINLVESGGRSLKPVKIKAERINLKGLQNILDSTREQKKFKTLLGDKVQGRSGAFSVSDARLFEAESLLRKKFDDVLLKIDDEAFSKNLIDAKGAYSKLKKQEQLIGTKKGISKTQIGSDFQNSFLVNKEDKFDAFRELIPDDLFKEATSKVLNQNTRIGGKLSGSSDKFSLILREVFQLVPKTAASLSAESIPFQAGAIPRAVVGTRGVTRRGIQQAGKGVFDFVKEGVPTRGLSGTGTQVLSGFQNETQ